MQQSPRRLLILGLAAAAMVGCIMFSKKVQATDATRLQGKPAPAVQVDLLGGGKLNLAEHKGKDVVILDFWATWCGPCVLGLPVTSEVAKEHADKGVVFYAINQEEDVADVQAFLKSKNLDIKVAIDSDGKVGKDYLVEGIPETVIIGRDGVVKIVHIGISENYKAELTRDVEKVIAGKN